ncbi:30S ribosomal protein S4 [Candidatus Karelsulcia muelleri]|uniref:30S ribosomal protein S4 n=1 Tax=Candidatus Karelsulcia muelleri TaxID=336810 RepID=UPI00236339FF|nr:30S ribosomal protein S4 [Candidatus Karelsulcia muelleri]WDE42265.1 30S ribosomal protein S4 [Candidatus Karelsulcia muelleri]WDR79113.1 30S ribosomal protein S4 [Candidatus Karelsulcia muelleri]
MARYIGPKNKRSIKFGIKNKRYPTGKPKIINFNKSNYSIQLLEKQKIKYIYGILEKQFRKIFEKAYKKKGITGEILLQLCESRLDNVVYRLNFANTRPGARQLVTHRHIFVNGKIVNIPSFTLKPGDRISVKEKLKDETIKQISKKKPKSWLKLELKLNKLTGIFKYIPMRDQLTEKIKERLVVELYSK